MRKISINFLLLLIAIPFVGVAQQEQIDLGMIAKIREEGLNRSQVMDIALHLTDLNGSRLTNSPGYKKAANYAQSTLSGWGVQNATIDPWGEFGKGWQLEKAYFAMTAPYYKTILAYPKTWCKGTKGLKKATLLV